MNSEPLTVLNGDCRAMLKTLDMFGGSGTVGKVALELGRKAILIELNAEYCELIQKRCRVTFGLPGLS